jgi:Tol biopolymer transport system component
VLSLVPASQLPLTLLTVPQHDRLRLTTSPASASLTTDGRYMAFTSYARLTPEDKDDSSDVYLLDRATGAATLLSAGMERFALNTDCAHPRISGDGRFVVFDSAITSEDGHSTGTGVVLMDRVTGTIRLVSRNTSGDLPNGWSASPAISDDGATIVFASAATDLVPGPDANGPLTDIYRFHVPTSALSRISLDTQGRQSPTGSSVAPSLSADGRHVAFSSSVELDAPARASGQPAGPRQGRPVWRVFVRDTSLNQTTPIAPRGTVPDGSSMQAAISRDGRFVAFVSQATNLVEDDRNRSADVFLHERSTGAIALVSRSVTGRSANGISGNPSISGDGRLIAFQSTASDLVCAGRCPPGSEDINLLPDVFVFDRQGGTMTRVSGGADGGWMEESGAPALDAAGGIIAFSSKHPIDARDVDDDFDLFVRVSSPGR